LWDRITATSYGFRIVAGAFPPLLDGDVILSLAGVIAGGLPLEQAEQLGSVAASARSAVAARVWRDDGLVALELPPSSGSNAAAPPDLDVERIRYGSGDILLVSIHDVREDLGQSLTTTLLKARAERPFLGVVLDLRGNGGGDPDGAGDALGLFMPGVPLFPMRRRHASVLPDRAAVPPPLDQWRGPLATLVDAETASAAEMMAGALMAYGRAPSIGEHTFGKGCVQEYFADAVGAGAMRLTTMVFALPDGSPLQKVGIEPTLPFAFGAFGAFGSAQVDNEAQLARAPEAWSGADVRVPHSVRSHRTAWPGSGSKVGPCSDDRVCGALALLSSESKRAATASRR
jgi:carboxyl-terminal processing protease